MKYILRSIIIAAFCALFPTALLAQTEIHITGPQTGFPVAVPQLCDAGGAGEYSKKLSEAISKNLTISGLFNVINPSSFIETPGKCNAPNGVAFSDWSIIGAEGLVKGDVKLKGIAGNTLEVRFFLFDVQQQRPVVGKRYESAPEDFQKIADRFTNEVIGFFTGEKGVFGSRIAYISKIGRFKELFVMDLNGSKTKQLTRDKGLVLSPSWSRAGDQIIYTSYVTRKPDLYIVPAKGGEARRFTKREGLELGAEYSPDGRSIMASATVLGVSNLVLFDLKGRLVRKVTKRSSIDISPSWSPDGRKVAFCSNRSGGPQIYTMGAKGGAGKRISFTPSNYCTSPAWSPKGDKIAYVCRDRGNQLYLSAPDGSQTVQLTFGGNNEDPSWSPDGRFLAFSSTLGRGGKKNIAVLPILTGRARQITFAKSENSMPAWSPRMD